MRKTTLWKTAAVTIAAVGLGGQLAVPHAGAQQMRRINLPAPELLGGPWFNTSDGKPITLASRLGKVTIVHFWTFG